MHAVADELRADALRLRRRADDARRARRGRQCLDAINNWLDAWQGKDLDRLRACYAPEFVELGTGRRLEAA